MRQNPRFIAAVIHYYNAYILNSLYENSTDEEERKYLAGLSPTAWIHINLLGYYEFNPQVVLDWVEQILQQWDWKKDENFINLNSD